MEKNYHTIYDVYRERHVQVPLVLLTNKERYGSLTDTARLAWALLRSRSDLSLKNNWIEKETGRIYFIFTVEDLMELLGKSKTTVVNLKKQLIQAGLLEVEKVGNNKPDKLFLLRPEVTDQDIYLIDEKDNYNYVAPEPKTEEPDPAKNDEKEPQTLDNSGGLKSGRPENEPPEVQNLYPSYIESSNIDFKDLKDQKIDDDDLYNTRARENICNSQSNEIDENDKIDYLWDLSMADPNFKRIIKFAADVLMFSPWDIYKMAKYLKDKTTWTTYDQDEAFQAAENLAATKVSDPAHFYAKALANLQTKRIGGVVSKQKDQERRENTDTKRIGFYNWLEERD